MKRFALSAASIALAVFVFGLHADAGHKDHGSYGSAGSVGSSGGSYGSGSSGGSYGSSGGSSGGISRHEARLIQRAERRAASHGSSGSLGSTGSSGGSYGSHGSSGGSAGSYGSTHGLFRGMFHGSSGSASSGGASSGSYGSASSGGYLQSGYAAPAAQYYLGQTSPNSALRPNTVPAVPTVTAPAVEFAYIVVQLPEDATLILGGNKTSVAGNVRKFKIPLSNSRESYPYTVRAEMTRGGQLFVAQSTETLVAGRTVSVKVNDVAAAAAVDVAAR